MSTTYRSANVARVPEIDTVLGAALGHTPWTSSGGRRLDAARGKVHLSIRKSMSYTQAVRMEWALEDVAYIGSRSQRYPGALDIELAWVEEVLSDPQLVRVTPYRRSRAGASAFVGRSPSANRVLVVIAYQDLDGDWHGMNAWPASGRDLTTYLEGTADE